MHSLGGLVLQSVSLQEHFVDRLQSDPYWPYAQCLTLSNEASASSHLYSIVESTIAIAFLGTPHAGADSLANWASKSAKFLSVVHNVNVEIVVVLKTDSEVLAILHESFTKMLKTREPKRIDITCFYEQKEVPLVGYVSIRYGSSICDCLTYCQRLFRLHLLNYPVGTAYLSTRTTRTWQSLNTKTILISFLCSVRFGVGSKSLKPKNVWTLWNVKIYRMIIDTRVIAVLLETTSMRKPATQDEFAATQHATYLCTKYDSPNDSFTISIATRLFVEEGLHQIDFSH